MSFRYLNEICEKLFQDKKKIILDIIQKNSQTKDVLYKERIDAVCNHLLKRFENEEKYEEKLEDIEFIKKIANHVKDKMNFEYVCFYENAENLSETVLMEIFCETIPNRYEEMRMSYNYYRLRLLLSHVSKYDYSKFLYTIDNLLKEKLDETLLEYFSLYPTDSIQSTDLLSIILLAEPIYFKCFKNNYVVKEPFHIRYLDIYKTYSEYKNAKTPEYRFNNTLMANISDRILYENFINRIKIEERNRYICEKFLKLKDCGISEFLKHDIFYTRYSFLSEKEKDIHYSEFQKNHDRILI
ncbi:790_t:CDS:1 [Cetraspora pellucida]|uniref:790_t:CDS:1 n=1 Tax=Cetraspora pellucida TaxID=1433469 RepID=A0ACA9KB58_9GLOM|nr:790_t:CDS:1 [Cetraspora pellucida]